MKYINSNLKIQTNVKVFVQVDIIQWIMKLKYYIVHNVMIKLMQQDMIIILVIL